MAVDLSSSACNKKGASLLATQACPQLSGSVTWHSQGTLIVNVWLCRRAQDQVHLCTRSFRLLLPARCQNRRQHMGRKRHTCCRLHHKLRICHSDKQHGCTHHLSAALPGCGETLHPHAHTPCPPCRSRVSTSRQAMPLAKGCQRACMHVLQGSILSCGPPTMQLSCLRSART